MVRKRGFQLVEMVVRCATAMIVVAPSQAGKVLLPQHGGSAKIGTVPPNLVYG
jgi:hypothetical protein